MTELEWLAATEVSEMLTFLGKKAGIRKRRLFACSCVRRIWHLLDDLRSRRAVEMAEAFADGKVSKEKAKCVQREAASASRMTPKGSWYPADAAAICLLQSIADIATAARAATAASHAGVLFSSERGAQVVLVRDIFCNPFRPVAFDPNWRTSTVVSLAQSMYENRDFSNMPILFDALQDAGCENEDILNHCRSDGPHVRGCWVVDLILGKE